MIPIISRMTYKSKQVELYYLSKSAPQHVDITSFADHSEDLLTFLNVEVKEYDIDNHIESALVFIHDWHNENKEKDLFLGAGWLKSRFSDTFSIPANAASDLIEKLLTDNLITNGTKKMASGVVKTSITLSEKGFSVISDIIQKASSATQSS